MKREEILKVAKPILFNTKMVKVILNNTKTVTRRPIKNNPVECTSKVVNGVCKLCDDKGGFYLPDDYVKTRSPYQVGDCLYVRETWAELETVYGGLYYAYKADDDILHHSIGENFTHWSPSIHMPKAAARIFLRVTSMKVERLQDITVTGLQEEGIIPDGYISQYACMTGMSECFADFKAIWNSTVKKSDLAKYGWDANPWVWVIEFERVEVE